MKYPCEVLAIVGPTASGKTALSIELAKVLNGEIINGDSMQIYRGLDIGTAKITEEEMQNIPHHLLDIKEPTESFSVAEYQSIVRAKIAEIQSIGKLPIIVGGTGLYVQSVLYDYQFTEDRVNDNIRQAYYEELERIGPVRMHEKLKEIDPESANVIHPNNTRRVIRAIEIAEHSSTQKSAGLHNRGSKPMYRHLIVGLDINRELLYERINMRVDQMMEKGLLEEANHLWVNQIKDGQAVQAIGYKELFGFFNGDTSLDLAVTELKQNSRRYAKRQFTYFRNKMNIHWVDPTRKKEEIIPEIIQKMQDSTR